MKLVTNKKDIGCFILFCIFSVCLYCSDRILTYICSLDYDRSLAEESYQKLYAKDMPNFKENYSVYIYGGRDLAVYVAEFEASVAEVNAMYDLSQSCVIEKYKAEEILLNTLYWVNTEYYDAHTSSAKKLNCENARDALRKIIDSKNYILVASDSDFEEKTFFFEGFILPKNSFKIFYVRMYDLKYSKGCTYFY